MKKKKLFVAALLIALLLVLAIPSAFASSEENPEIVEIISTVVEEESKEEIAEEPKEEPAEEPEEKAAEEPEEEPAEESVEEAAEENEEEPAEESKKMETEVSTASNEIVIIDKSTGTAPFTIEATFNGKQVKFDGKTSYSLADLAADLGIEGTIVGAKSSEESLFNVVDDKFESYTTFVNEYDLTFIMDDGSTFVVTVSDDTNVAKVNGTEYADINAAIAAANAGDTVYIIVPTFDSDINLTKALTLVGKSDDKGTKTTLKGTISGVTNCTIDNFIFSSTFSNTLTNCTIKNCTFIGTEAGGDATRWLYTNGNTVFDNCTFDPKGQYGIHFDGNPGGNVLVKNCSIKGTVALSGPNISFLGCKFEGRSTSGHCNINIYGKALFNNCTFDEAYTNGSSRGILMLGDNDSASVTMNNCSVNSETYSIEDVFRFDWRQGTGLIDAKLNLGKNVVSGIVAVSKNADIASIVAAGSTYSLLKADQNGNTWEVTAPETSPVSDQKEDNRIVVTVEGDSNVRVEAEISEKKAVISDITAEAIKEAINVNNSNGSVKIDCSNTGSAVSQVEIKADSIKTIASSDVKELKVSMDSGSIALDKAAISSVAENLDGKTVTLVVENVKENVLNDTQQKAVETALASKQNAKVVAVIDSYILTDTSKIKDLGSGTAKLEISADNLASVNGNLDNLVIYEISEDGTMKKVEFKIVDGKIVINANKLAQYVITVE